MQKKSSVQKRIWYIESILEAQSMSDTLEYTFKIENFTPETMPFGRLVEYYVEIKRMLGVSENLHLIGVVEGSHGSAFAIDRNYETALIERLQFVNQGTAPSSAMRAQSAINKMLKDDGTSGAFYGVGGQNVVNFPGNRTDDSAQLRIKDAATFTGELYHIAGTQNDAKVRISTDAYGVVFCITTKDIAKDLRDFLFEDVKVSGRGMWTRDERGTWSISEFFITDFAPVERENLRKAIERIRAIDVDWPNDTLGNIRSFEEKNGTM
jgi:hypothetical protein